MLTARQNFIEAITGGNPDRFVNQYEALGLIVANPIGASGGYPRNPGETAVDFWGVTHTYEPGTPGPFPVHDEEHKVIKDITKWRESIKVPNLIFPDAMWDGMKVPMVDAIDTEQQLATLFFPVGLFERLHYLMGIEETLMNLLEEPEEMHELLDVLTDFEIGYAEQVCTHWPIEAVFHHDDWGTQKSSFMSPAMFEEFFVPRYKKIYDTYRKLGVKYIIHHNDAYSANLVPQMIEMGIDVWQGALSVNDIPALIEKYGDKISIMGGIDNGILDRVDWTYEKVEEFVTKLCNDCGKKAFIPCMCAGMPGSAYEGVYDAVSDVIAKLNG